MISKKIPRGEHRDMNMRNEDQVLVCEFKMTLSKNDWENSCMCDSVDLIDEAKGHEKFVQLMMKATFALRR